YAAVAGQSTIVVFATADGKPVGRMPLGVKSIEPVKFWAMGFDESGTELRAAYLSDKGAQLRTWSMSDGQVRHSGTVQIEKPYGGTIVSGPEPGTLILGGTIVDLTSGKPIMDAPGPVHQWAGPNRVLVRQNVIQAVNRKALEDSVDYHIMIGVFLYE